MNKKKCHIKGSLLLETLLSVLILSTSISLILQAMTSSLRAMRYSADYTEALFIAENELFDALSHDAFGEEEFDLQEEIDGKYTSSITSELFVDEAMVGGEEGEGIVNDTQLSVSWRSGSKNNKLLMHTFLFEEGE